jgi:hypothetical protein
MSRLGFIAFLRTSNSLGTRPLVLGYDVMAFQGLPVQPTRPRLR